MPNPFGGEGFGYFFADNPQSASTHAMRQKIALAMMMKKDAYPKTFGEGLSSIGESIGDALMAKSTLRNAAEQAAQADKQIKTIEGATTPGRVSDAAVPGAATDQVAAVTPADTEATVQPAAPPVAAADPAGNYGYRPPPAYLAAALARNPRVQADPERGAYLGHLAGKEARSANEVSSTGAAGPFQFTRGTGAQYGIPGSKRFDADASIDAVNRLTDDNAATLAKALGRSPTGSELALAHQQGAGTAAKMILGTGNASAANLAVNNAGGGPQQAANKIMSYYGMPDRNPARDNAAAVLASRPPPPAGPAGPQDALLGEVTGMAGPAAAASFAPTASLGRTGDVTSDMPSVTGAVGGPAGAGVVDTLQQRNDAMRPPQAAAPPPGPQTAQAGPFPAPTMDASGRVAPILPGGGFPPQQIPTAPQDPRAAIQKAPAEYEPKDRPMPQPPTKPGPGPVEQEYGRLLYADVDDRVKLAAKAKIDVERAQRGAVYENELKTNEIEKQQWLKEQELILKYRMERPQTSLAIQKAHRDLVGEGAVPLTAEQRTAYGIPATQAAYMTRNGEIKFGPAGTNISIDTKAQGKGDERLQEKLSESFIKSFEEGNTAGDEIKQLAEMRALAAKVGTGAGAVIKQYLGQWGVKTEGLSEIQALQAGIARVIPAQRVPGSGTSSDFDGGMFRDSVVGLAKTPEGNALIFDTMEGLAKNKLARADVSGRVISGEITRSEGVKEMLGLQREARALSDKVKAFSEATGKTPAPAPAIPTDDAMKKWLQDNPTHPKAGVVRQQLGL